ncbi:MAG: divalent metal cation transporter, partial [Planctomycetes bacterium]|nr:divalent metal cation transporter [Planctomycetota bacterium]
ITAAATAVGINMTFLLPYSMLARGWDRDFRGLAIFDLSTGLFIPFLLATSCVVIASASQFHAQPAAGFVDGTSMPAKNLVGGFNKLVDGRLKQELGDEKFSQLQTGELEQARQSLPEADRKLAAMLVTRDAFNLADSLKPLTGTAVGQYVFGIGVLGMAISTIIILMLINGFVVCEMLGLPSQGTPHRIGCYLAALTGAVGSFYWTGDAKIWLAVPTSMFGMVLLPIAYVTFFLMINSKSLLGENRPKGAKRFFGNILMGIAAAMAAFGSFWSIKSSGFPVPGFIVFGAFVLLAVIVHLVRKPSMTDE